jgi:hypothetical protein
MLINYKSITKKYIIPILLTVILTSTISLIVNGIPIFGVPKVSQIKEVSVARDGVVKSITDPEEVVLAHNLIKSLSYTIGEYKDEKLQIKMEFYLEDGSIVEYGASENLVYINGKYYKSKNNRGDRFIKLAEAIFFYKELVSEEYNS